MSYYKTCPACGSNLDPGESCDCERKAAASAANTDNGRAEKRLLNIFSAFHNTKNTREEARMMETEYREAIMRQLEQTDDIAILDFIYQLLAKSAGRKPGGDVVCQ